MPHLAAAQASPAPANRCMMALQHGASTGVAGSAAAAPASAAAPAPSATVAGSADNDGATADHLPAHRANHTFRQAPPPHPMIALTPWMNILARHQVSGPPTPPTAPTVFDDDGGNGWIFTHSCTVADLTHPLFLQLPRT